MDIVSKSLEETEKEAKKLADTLCAQGVGEGARVLLLQGDLGSGKTAFTKALVQALGGNGPVTSPTFVLAKIYTLSRGPFKKLVHIDAYRLEGAHEATPLHLSDFFNDREAVVVIEWPERIHEALPQDATRIQFSFVDETTRHITFHG